MSEVQFIKTKICASRALKNLLTVIYSKITTALSIFLVKEQHQYMYNHTWLASLVASSSVIIKYDFYN